MITALTKCCLFPCLTILKPLRILIQFWMQGIGNSTAHHDTLLFGHKTKRIKWLLDKRHSCSNSNNTLSPFVFQSVETHSQSKSGRPASWCVILCTVEQLPRLSPPALAQYRTLFTPCHEFQTVVKALQLQPSSMTERKQEIDFVNNILDIIIFRIC